MNRQSKNTPNHIDYIPPGRAEGHFPWPTKFPILSADAERRVGNRYPWLIYMIEKSAQIDASGIATYDRGNARLGRDVLFWELRAYDTHLLYRNFDYGQTKGQTQVIIVVTLAEAIENHRLKEMKHAEELARYYPPMP